MLALVAATPGVGGQQPGALPPSHHINWHRGASGVEYAEFELAGSGEAWRTRVVLVRVDPAGLRFTLDTAFATPFRAREHGLDVGRRDARLALGRLRDGRLLIVLSILPGTRPLPTG